MNRYIQKTPNNKKKEIRYKIILVKNFIISVLYLVLKKGSVKK